MMSIQKGAENGENGRGMKEGNAKKMERKEKQQYNKRNQGGKTAPDGDINIKV